MFPQIKHLTTLTLYLFALYLYSSLAQTALTGSYSCYYSQLVALPTRSSIITQINSARTNPSTWATIIQSKYFNLGSSSDITEAINYMNAATPMAALTESQGLDVAAQTQANYLKVNGWGTNPHAGCNNNQPWDRITAIGIWGGIVGENIVGGASNPEKMVAIWLIDSGVPSRGHRLNIMNTGYTLIGVGISSTTVESNTPTVVTDFTGTFTCNSPCASLPPMDVNYTCSVGYPSCSGTSNTGNIKSSRSRYYYYSVFGVISMMIIHLVL